MANYELVNADQLDSDLTAVGDAIRSKGGTSEKLSFPSGMVSAISAISTGVELNFDVVPGLTQPGTATENTIWVKTEKIGAWYFSATQPEVMQEWDVWFPTDTSSSVEFNALKKNGIQVCPMSVQQYVGGVLEAREASLHQNGQWVQFSWNRVYLYKEGDINTDLTGGFNVSGYTWSNSSVGFASPSFNSDYISCTGVKDTKPGGVGTVKKVDLTKYKWICVDANYSNTHDDNAIIVSNTKDAVLKSHIAMQTNNGTGRQVYRMNVSDYSSAYIVVSVVIDYNVKIYNIWLE